MKQNNPFYKKTPKDSREASGFGWLKKILITFLVLLPTGHAQLSEENKQAFRQRFMALSKPVRMVLTIIGIIIFFGIYYWIAITPILAMRAGAKNVKLHTEGITLYTFLIISLPIIIALPKRMRDAMVRRERKYTRAIMALLLLIFIVVQWGYSTLLSHYGYEEHGMFIYGNATFHHTEDTTP